MKYRVIEVSDNIHHYYKIQKSVFGIYWSDNVDLPISILNRFSTQLSATEWAYALSTSNTIEKCVWESK